MADTIHSVFCLVTLSGAMALVFVNVVRSYNLLGLIPWFLFLVQQVFLKSGKNALLLRKQW